MEEKAIENEKKLNEAPVAERLKTRGEIARELIETMDPVELRRLKQNCRQSWTRSQSETIKTDKIHQKEVAVIDEDEDLALMLIEKSILDKQIADRIRYLLDEFRPVPYQISSEGIQVNLSDYSLPLLKDVFENTEFDLTIVHHKGIVYIKPTKKTSTILNRLKEVIDLLDEIHGFKPGIDDIDNYGMETETTEGKPIYVSAPAPGLEKGSPDLKKTGD